MLKLLWKHYNIVESVVLRLLSAGNPCTVIGNWSITVSSDSSLFYSGGEVIKSMNHLSLRISPELNFVLD